MRLSRLQLSFTLISAFLIYCFFYLAHPDLPGNNLSHPLGWWGWFDQGFYLRAALDLYQHNYNPANHYYPPFYPYIGSLFIKKLPMHPFFFFDAFAFLLFVWAFIYLALRYIRFETAFILFALVIYANKPIMATFVVPWTTACTLITYSLALVIIAVLSASEACKFSKRIGLALGLSFSFGALALARPIDALLAGVFFSAFVLTAIGVDRALPWPKRISRAVPVCGILLIGPVVAIFIFYAFNIKVFGNAFGGYFGATATASGYFPFEVIKKSFSLLIDSKSLYLSDGSSLLTHYPWIPLAIAGMCVTFARGDALLRTLAVALLVHFSLYAPYGDLLPNGVWRYSNIHYFKWMFPWLALFAWLAIRWMLAPPAYLLTTILPRAGLVAALVILQLSITFKIATRPVGLMVSPNENITINLTEQRTDFVDINGLTGTFDQIYFGQHKMTLDGKKLDMIKDFRLLPAASGVRVLFNQAHDARQIILQPDPALYFNTNEAASAKAGRYSIGFGVPRLRHD